MKPGPPLRDELRIFVSVEDASSLAREIRETGLSCSRRSNLTIDDPHGAVALVISGIGFAAGASAAALDRLARAVSAWAHRDDGKSIELTESGTIRRIDGFSLHEIREILETVREEQRAIDAHFTQLREDGANP